MVEKNCLAGLKNVDVDLLWDNANTSLSGILMTIKIEAEYVYLAAALVDKRRDYPDSGRFPSAVRSKQSEKISFCYG